MLALAVAGAGCESESGPEVAPAPTISAVSADTTAPGDTVMITGTHFLADPGRNTVRFTNGLGTAIPFAASSTLLRVVVPRHAATGPVSVSVEGNPTVAVGSAVVVPREVGEVWIWQGTGSGHPLKLPSPSASAEYLIIPHPTNPARPYNEIFHYTVTASQADAFPSPPGGGVARTARRPVGARGTVTIRERFEAHLHEEARLLQHHAGWAVSSRRVPSAQPDTLRNFFVLSTREGSTQLPSSFSEVTAELRHAGDWCLVYADVDTLPTGNFTPSDFQHFADEFDNTFRPNATQFFGTESDVDENEKVIILITPVVNRLTPPDSDSFISGFFLCNDLTSADQGQPPGTTNFAEILYMLAADPDSIWGNPFPVAFTVQENLKTIVHEYQHLISFSYRKFQQGSAFQAEWLEEGMSHMAEDLNGLNSSNVARANRYLSRPDTMTLEWNFDPPLEQRGAIYLFLRWLGDRFDETLYAQILQSDCVGRACIESITGEDFFVTVGDWLATLYLSGKGINTSDTYNYQSIDLGTFTPVPVRSRSVDGSTASGALLRSTGDFYLFTNPTTVASTFVFGAPSTARLRAVVVQTK